MAQDVAMVHVSPTIIDLVVVQGHWSALRVYISTWRSAQCGRGQICVHLLFVLPQLDFVVIAARVSSCVRDGNRNVLSVIVDVIHSQVGQSVNELPYYRSISIVRIGAEIVRHSAV